MKSQMNDEEKVFLVTGGEGDLAKSMGSMLAGEGKVLLPGRQKLDVVEEASVDAYFATLKRLDLIVCNAGLVADDLLLKMSEASWEKALEVNLKGAFLCAQQAAKLMLKQRSGHILFVGSYSGFKPHLGQSNYASAKAGLVGLMKSLAQELGGRGVRVNMVVPGWLDTKMTAAVAEERKREMIEAHTLKALNTTQQVASFVKHLHGEMHYTSGQVFHLDSRILP